MPYLVMLDKKNLHIHDKKENIPDIWNPIELRRLYPYWFDFSKQVENYHLSDRNRMKKCLENNR